MRRCVRFVGRVQGVGFRATARFIALKLLLTGWVRNDIDGSVQMEAQGEIHNIVAFVSEIRQTFGGKIVSVDQYAIDEVDGESGFVIRR